MAFLSGELDGCWSASLHTGGGRLERLGDGRRAGGAGDVRAIQGRIAGLKRAQLVERTAAREEQIGELEYELDERKRKFRKYGHW